jgi:hypothetical protein
MPMVLLKICGIWILLVVSAILNGVLRDKLLSPLIGARLALPLSGVSLSLLIFVVTLLLLPFLGKLDSARYWLIGGIWLAMTIAFEFLFGHYVMGQPWEKILGAYNVLSGNLWLLILLATAASPHLAAKLRGLI